MRPPRRDDPRQHSGNNKPRQPLAITSCAFRCSSQKIVVKSGHRCSVLAFLWPEGQFKVPSTSDSTSSTVIQFLPWAVTPSHSVEASRPSLSAARLTHAPGLHRLRRMYILDVLPCAPDRMLQSPETSRHPMAKAWVRFEKSSSKSLFRSILTPRFLDFTSSAKISAILMKINILSGRANSLSLSEIPRLLIFTVGYTFRFAGS